MFPSTSSVESDTNWKTFEDEFSENGLHHKSLHHVFRKHVKPKKQHEIARMAKVANYMRHISGWFLYLVLLYIFNYLVVSECGNVIDIGSGVGHLARLLSYRHEFNVVSVDTESDFTSSAKKFDNDLMTFMNKKNQNCDTFQKPKHLTFRLEAEMETSKLETELATKLDVKVVNYLFVFII